MQWSATTPVAARGLWLPDPLPRRTGGITAGSGVVSEASGLGTFVPNGNGSQAWLGVWASGSYPNIDISAYDELVFDIEDVSGDFLVFLSTYSNGSWNASGSVSVSANTDVVRPLSAFSGLDYTDVTTIGLQIRYLENSNNPVSSPEFNINSIFLRDSTAVIDNPVPAPQPLAMLLLGIGLLAASRVVKK